MRKKLQNVSRGILMLVFVSIISFVASAQESQISGKISDSAGDGLPGASILVKGTNRGTTTDANGNFKLAAASNATLLVSSIGYLNQEINIGGKTVINLSLATDTKALDEVGSGWLWYTKEKPNDRCYFICISQANY